MPFLYTTHTAMAFRRFKRSTRRFRRNTKKATVSPNVRRYVAKAIRKTREVNYLDTSISAAVTTTPAITQLNILPQNTAGGGQGIRRGEEVHMLSIQLKGYVLNADSTPHRIRMMLVYDKQPNGAAFTSNDILTGNGYNGALRDLDWKGRFLVIKDWFFDLAPKDLDDKGLRIINYHKKLPRLVTKYDGSTGDGVVTEITKGSLYLFMVSSDAADGVTRTLTARLRYLE